MSQTKQDEGYHAEIDILEDLLERSEEFRANAFVSGLVLGFLCGTVFMMVWRAFIG